MTDSNLAPFLRYGDLAYWLKIARIFPTPLSFNAAAGIFIWGRWGIAPPPVTARDQGRCMYLPLCILIGVLNDDDYFNLSPLLAVLFCM